MADVQYPVHVYKHLNRPRYAHNKKDLDALREDGWTEQRNNIPMQEYPKTLYSPEGNRVTVGDYDERTGAVDEKAAKAQELKLSKGGYGTTPPERVETPVKAQVSTGSPAGRIDVLEERVNSIDEKLNLILESLTAGAKK
jgi:hypothetical protein